MHFRKEETMKLYIGNLPPEATEQEITPLLSRHGKTDWVQCICDPATGRSRGIALAEIDDGRTAAERLNGSDFKGRYLYVTEIVEPGAGGGTDGEQFPSGDQRMIFL
jgi:RNA recognition motif-containing protein